jgi:hypothetical protein
VREGGGYIRISTGVLMMKIYIYMKLLSVGIIVSLSAFLGIFPSTLVAKGELQVRVEEF